VDGQLVITEGTLGSGQQCGLPRMSSTATAHLPCAGKGCSFNRFPVRDCSQPEPAGRCRLLGRS
jgi:hypothetical protein